MGTILHTLTKDTVILAAYSVVGRVRRSTVVLHDHAASMTHASISWNGAQWELHDFASTNGTWVNGERVVDKVRKTLKRGDILRFGTDAEQWELIDERGPIVVARCITTNEEKIATGAILALPDETNLDVSILCNVDGRWLIEFADGSRRNVQNGDRIETAGRTWELTVPPEVSFVGTHKAKPSLALATITLQFHMSHDGDHVGIDILHDDGKVCLGTKTRFDLLAHLAGQRQTDAHDGSLPESDQGWYYVQDLVRHMGTTEKYINVLIYRIREAFSEQGIEGAEGIIERRPKQVRLGTGRIQGITT